MTDDGVSINVLLMAQFRDACLAVGVNISAALFGCDAEAGHDRFYVTALRDTPVFEPGGSEDELESSFRDWLGEVHMDSDDIDCMVEKAKTHPSWRDEPRRWFLPASESNRLASECQVDWTKTYFLYHD